MFATVEEIAAAEKINASYVGRVLRLTLLAPDVVESILDGRQPARMTLAVLMRPFAVGPSGHRRADGTIVRAQPLMPCSLFHEIGWHPCSQHFA